MSSINPLSNIHKHEPVANFIKTVEECKKQYNSATDIKAFAAFSKIKADQLNAADVRSLKKLQRELKNEIKKALPEKQAKTIKSIQVMINSLLKLQKTQFHEQVSVEDYDRKFNLNESKRTNIFQGAMFFRETFAESIMGQIDQSLEVDAVENFAIIKEPYERKNFNELEKFFAAFIKKSDSSIDDFLTQLHRLISKQAQVHNLSEAQKQEVKEVITDCIKNAHGQKVPVIVDNILTKLNIKNTAFGNDLSNTLTNPVIKRIIRNLTKNPIEEAPMKTAFDAVTVFCRQVNYTLPHILEAEAEELLPFDKNFADTHPVNLEIAEDRKKLIELKTKLYNTLVASITQTFDDNFLTDLKAGKISAATLENKLDDLTRDRLKKINRPLFDSIINAGFNAIQSRIE